GARPKLLTLARDEFIRRYLHHVPPKGFHLVRGYGLYRRGGSSEALRRRVREVVPVTPQLHAALTARPPMPSASSATCPLCGAHLLVVWSVPGAAALPSARAA